uniref:Uncharacterized protein n=1 Tax=Rhizophagus irregularis (strain DAOM 181602 / DAOM 197198 / MUCL 43194) TaxID=747089 RepID=U9TZB5_RHIID
MGFWRPEVSLDRQAVWLLWTQDFGERPECVVQGNQLQYEYRNPVKFRKKKLKLENERTSTQRLAVH